MCVKATSVGATRSYLLCYPDDDDVNEESPASRSCKNIIINAEAPH